MVYDDDKKENRIANFRKKFAFTKGGIFTNKKREKIMGTIRRTGRNRKESDFWQDVRNYVKGALLDLQLFLEFADEKDIKLVMTGERLQPLIQQIASAKYPFDTDFRKADIANILIQNGFRHFYYSKNKDITLSHKRTINEALDLSRYLVSTFVSPEHRQYVSGMTNL